MFFLGTFGSFLLPRIKERTLIKLRELFPPQLSIVLVLLSGVISGAKHNETYNSSIGRRSFAHSLQGCVNFLDGVYGCYL